jgi:hypothetical protein
LLDEVCELLRIHQSKGRDLQFTYRFSSHAKSATPRHLQDKNFTEVLKKAVIQIEEQKHRRGPKGEPFTVYIDEKTHKSGSVDEVSGKKGNSKGQKQKKVSGIFYQGQL